MQNSEKTNDECEAIYLSFLIKHRRKPKPEELAQLLLEEGKSSAVISQYIQQNLRHKVTEPEEANV